MCTASILGCQQAISCLLSQEELERSQRLRTAQQEFEIDDDMIGGQQGNSLLELIKQGKLHKKAPPTKKDDKAAASSRPVSAGPTTEVCCIRPIAFTPCMLHSSSLGTWVYKCGPISDVCCRHSLQLHYASCDHCSHMQCAIDAAIHVGLKLTLRDRVLHDTAD